MSTELAPIQKSITVECPQERAFRVFTEKVEAWWPKDHHLVQTSPLKHVILEPHLDGRWYEVCEDGSTCNWGKVLAWEPPRRLVLSWQIDATWQYNAAMVTEVEVIFTPAGPTRTHVALEHRYLDRLGDAAAASATRSQLEPGWEATLALYAQVAQG